MNLEALPELNENFNTPESCDVRMYTTQQKVEYNAWLDNCTAANSSRDDKFVHVVLLGMVMSNMKDPISMYRLRNTPKSGQGGKQSKSNIQGQMTYRRMFTFGDLSSSSGRVCVMFEKNAADQLALWKFARDARIGDHFAILEPCRDPSWLGIKMPIITTPMPLLPLAVPATLPGVAFTPAEPYTSRFFVLHGATVTAGGARLVTTNCTGKFCDRRKVEAQGDCGCYHRDRNAGRCHVLQLDLDIEHPDIANPLMVAGWSSLRFTEMAFAGSLPAEVNLDNYALRMTYRRTISSLVTYVNANGGWTILGWHRLGVTKDASISGAEDTTTFSENSTMHFEMVVPTVAQNQCLLVDNNCICGVNLVQAAS